MSEILFDNHLISFSFKNKKRVKRWLELVILSYHKFPHQIQFIFCSDSFLSGINKQYLRHTSLTDIITFNYSYNHYVSGDIFISIDRIKENSEIYDVDFETELHRVMVHGILHLLGFEDKSPFEKRKMRKKENEAIIMLESA